MLAIAFAIVTIGLARGDEPVEFAREVAPILEKQCLKCHREGEKKGGIALESLSQMLDDGLVVPGEPGESGLIDAVAEPEGGGRAAMPKSGAPLAKAEVDIIRQWIAQGAPWPDGLKLADRSKADKGWWSLQPLADSEPPTSEGSPAGWDANPIDRFLFAKMADKGLHPNGEADRRTLIRRLTYDLTGLPPTPEEVAAFERDDDPHAYERLVDRLLASPRYGERWARHWLDVVRFGESRGYERNEIIPNAWPFRDYVIRSLNDDKPFDRLVLEHLAGDVIGKDDPAVEVGTAYLVAGPYDDVGNQDAAQAAQIRANTVDDVISATGTAFLGLTIGCARCHDHKFDPIAQADYYRWYATFDGIRHASREVASPADRQAREAKLAPLQARRASLASEREALVEGTWKRAQEQAPPIEATWVRPPAALAGTDDPLDPVEARFLRLIVDGTDGNPAATSGYQIDEIEVWTAGEEPPRNVALASHGTLAEGPYRAAQDFAGAYSPAQAIDGKYGATWVASGPILTLTFPAPERIGRVVFSTNRAGDFHKPFPAEYRLEISLDGESWTEVSSGRDRKPVSEAHRRHRLMERETTPDDRARLADLDRQIGATDAEIASVPPLPSWWVGQFAQPGPTNLFKGGDPQKRGDEIHAASLGTLEIVAPKYELAPDSPEGERRLALARWIVDPSNPLTPRVLANRLWNYHFGTGIVDTPSDFGFMGGEPSHPELLDWLARQLVAGGWKLKPMHRLIVTSAAYKQAGTYLDEAARVDATDRLLWRFRPRRLEAEELRDTFLEVAGVLKKEMGGPGFRLYQYLQDNVSTYNPLDHHGPETYRRTIYHHNARAAPVDLLSEFDCPDNAFSAPHRDHTTTPLQALTLLNHSFTADMARALASRLQREAGPDATAQVALAYRLAYARSPSEAESREASEFARANGLEPFCRALLNSTEIMYLD
jgi:hypothetical protein